MIGFLLLIELNMAGWHWRGGVYSDGWQIPTFSTYPWNITLLMYLVCSSFKYYDGHLTIRSPLNEYPVLC